MEGGRESLLGAESLGIEMTEARSSASLAKRGEKLLPNEQEQVPFERRALRWSLLGSIALLELGLLTLAYDIGTQQDALDGAAQGDAETAEHAEEVAEQQHRLNENQTLGHDKAKACIAIGIVVLVLTVVTAAVRGELQRWARRSFLFMGSERKLSRTIGQCLTLVYITLCVTVPFMVYLTFFVLRLRPHDVAWLVASIFTAMTVFMSVREIRLHLVNYSSPPLQKHIIRILWMPPVYAVNCYVSMRFDSAGVYLTVIRELYEAFCVWSFMALMMEFLHNVASLRRSASSRSLHTAEEMAALDTEFERFDSNSDGFIDLVDLGMVFQSLNIVLSEPELQDVMDSFDLDGDSRLDKSEFVQVMSLKLTDQDEKDAFDALDKDSSGTVTLADFVEVTMLMGFDEAESRALAASAPGDRGDQISRQQFHEILGASPVFSVRLGILQRVGVLWALQHTNQGQSGNTGDIRYREVAQMLQAAAEAARAEGSTGGHAHGEDGDDGCSCCKPAPCEAGEHPHMPPFHKARPWKQGLEFLHKCRVGVLQYVACQVRVRSFSFCSTQQYLLTRAQSILAVPYRYSLLYLLSSAKSVVAFTRATSTLALVTSTSWR